MQCRICLDEENTGDLISPCECKGTMRYVHRTCLNKWRVSAINTDSQYFCDQCQFEYILVNPVKPNIFWKKLENS